MSTKIDTNKPILPATGAQSEPKEGPKAFPLVLDFDNPPADKTYTLDFGQVQRNPQFSNVQSVFIDNKDNAAAFTMYIGTSAQRVVCPAKSQGYFMLITPNPATFEFTTQGNGQIPLFLLNYPVNTAVWSV